MTTATPPAGPDLLTLQDVALSVPGPTGFVPVLVGVDLRVGRGEIVGLAGESGSGKSMTARTIMNLVPRGARVTGRRILQGRDLATLDDDGWRALRGARIAMVHQDPTASLHPMLTIGRQITEHVVSHERVDQAVADDRAVDLLAKVRIPDPRGALDAHPHRLSGGMRQRAAIAVALAARPELLIADEPTTSLDVTVQAGILRLLDRLRREEGLSVLYVSHDLGTLSALTDRTSIMYAGRVVETGPTTSVLHRPLHPYTRSLLAAQPDAGTDMVPIRGAPPPPHARPTGCSFHPRCPHVVAECRDTDPAARAILDREVRCLVVDVDGTLPSLHGPATGPAPTTAPSRDPSGRTSTPGVSRG